MALGIRLNFRRRRKKEKRFEESTALMLSRLHDPAPMAKIQLPSPASLPLHSKKQTSGQKNMIFLKKL